VSTFGRTGNANYVQTIDRLTALRITCICRALGVRSGNSFYLGGSGFALVTAAISWSTTLLPDLPPMSSISFTLTSVSFFASSSAFWLPELCCAIVSLLTCFIVPVEADPPYLFLELLILVVLLLFVLFNLLLRFVSCVLYSLCAVLVG
jgi:hypothetical protein